MCSRNLLPDISLAYKVSIPGYPQAAPILSTAYENQDFDGDGKADGRVYLYFTYNAISRRNLHAGRIHQDRHQEKPKNCFVR